MLDFSLEITSITQNVVFFFFPVEVLLFIFRDFIDFSLIFRTWVEFGRQPPAQFAVRFRHERVPRGFVPTTTTSTVKRTSILRPRCETSRGEIRIGTGGKYVLRLAIGVISRETSSESSACLTWVGLPYRRGRILRPKVEGWIRFRSRFWRKLATRDRAMERIAMKIQ